MVKKKIAMVLGIRPDVIRASLVLNKIRDIQDFETVFIWTGQHYSDNLKDIFFRELGVKPPDVELNAKGENDAELSSSVIAKLYPVLQELQPEAVVFLGDTNTVMGCLAAAQLNIPIVHIEGCMRSYDWRMPEEKYRCTIDHLSDIIYTYFNEYKQQGVAEGLNPKSIIVIGNLIVDVLNAYFFAKKDFYDQMASQEFFRNRGLEKGQFYLLTCHRRENVHVRASFENIIRLIGSTDRKIYFPASYRTQKVIREYRMSLPKNVIMVDPVGFQEMLTLMANARGVLTDSGTVVEETCVLQVPSLQMRKSTERPQVYDAGSSVKFDPTKGDLYPAEKIFHKLDKLFGKKWQHNLGDGQASQRIVDDLAKRMKTGNFRLHLPDDYHLDIRRSYREDGL